MTDTINTITAKGYIVNAIDNMEFGKINQFCPVVYEILKPDYTTVYGANSIAPADLVRWIDLPDLNQIKKPAPITVTVADPDRAKKERDYDNLYNEGAEGFNPYR